jgi:hypothetical protein
MRYSTARVGGGGRFRPGSITEIATPAFVYGRAYATVVSGGRVASRPGAGTLLIAACRRAATVTVTVRPTAKPAHARRRAARPRRRPRGACPA